MRIWFVNQNAYAPDQFSGTRHYALAKNLIDAGHEALILASSFYHKGREESRLNPGEMSKRQRFGKVPFHWVRAPGYQNSQVRRVLSMAAFARNVAARHGLDDDPAPDVVVGSSPSPFGAWAGLRLARHYGVPFILEIRDVWPDTLVELGGLSRRHPFILFLAWLERHLYRNADAIVTVLPYAHEHIAERGGRREAIHWIPNGIEVDSVPQTDPPARADGTVLFQYAGAHGLYNGLETLLHAAKRLQDDPATRHVRIRLTGDGPAKPRLQEQARELGLENVSFHEPVAKTEIYGHLAQADGFLMLLRDAGVFRHGISPNKLWDYMAVGRPLVFSVKTTSNPVEEAGAGVTVPPDAPEALARGIADLAQMSAEERRQLGARARAYAERNHDMRRLAERYAELCDELTFSSAPDPDARAA